MFRKTIALLGICIMLFLTLAGCVEQNKSETYIGIISAMDNEIAMLLKEANIERVDTVAGVNYHVGTLRGHRVVITRSGIGKVRCASVVTTMLNDYPISEIIFTGIAGGVKEETKVLDQIIATRLVEHDYGILNNDGFVWRSGDPGFGGEPGVYYYCDDYLVGLAYQASVEVVGAEHTFKGTIATGDQFIASESYVQKLQQDYDAYACEMEGASVAVICINYHVPFVVLRCLSDKADGNAHESYDNFGDLAGDHSAHIVLKMLENLQENNDQE